MFNTNSYYVAITQQSYEKNMNIVSQNKEKSEKNKKNCERSII